jgi:nicotinate-nucleotide adenylyltransferase
MIPNRPPGHVERVGILGGTFDPVHLGHLILASSALEELVLDRVIFIPARTSPHKMDSPPTASGTQRLEMIRLAIDGESRFSVDERELRGAGSSPSYTIDTVRSLMADYPGVRFLYLIGADNVGNLSTWHEVEELRNLIDFAVFERARDGECGSEDFEMVHRRIDISSTEIRERLAKGLPVRYFLPSTVHDYIMTRRLYSSPLTDGQA